MTTTPDLREMIKEIVREVVREELRAAFAVPTEVPKTSLAWTKKPPVKAAHRKSRRRKRPRKVVPEDRGFVGVEEMGDYLEAVMTAQSNNEFLRAELTELIKHQFAGRLDESRTDVSKDLRWHNSVGHAISALIRENIIYRVRTGVFKARPENERNE